MSEIIAINGDITYPKSEALIIPANTHGLTSRGISNTILNSAGVKIRKEVKKYCIENNVEIKQCFKTGSGRLVRRKVKNIYHCTIRHYLNDLTSICVVSEALQYTLNQVIEDNHQSVTITSLGIEEGDLGKITVANIFIDICEKYKDKIDIKILDLDKEFIEEINKKISREKNENT